MKEFDLERVEAKSPRFKEEQVRAGNYIVPVPDYVWYVDSHMKFRAMELRFLLWLMVTSSMSHQSLLVCQQHAA